MTTSNVSTLLDRNAAFAATDARANVPDIPFIPFRQVYLITCIDPRVEPAAVLGVELGEAIVARNVGGRVTPAVIQDLAWIIHLHEHKTPGADWFEIAVLHHTDCGSALLSDEELRKGNTARGGYGDRVALEMAVLDPHATVRDDVRRLHTAPELASAIDAIRIGGYAYDLETGVVTTLVEPGAA